MYIVKLENGETWKRYIEQLKKCYNTEEQHSPPDTIEEDFGPAVISTGLVPMHNTLPIPTPTTTTTSSMTTIMRRSTQDKQPPDRYAAGNC